MILPMKPLYRGSICYVRLGQPTSIREGGNGAAITTSIGVAAAMARGGGFQGWNCRTNVQYALSEDPYLSFKARPLPPTAGKNVGELNVDSFKVLAARSSIQSDLKRTQLQGRCESS